MTSSKKAGLKLTSFAIIYLLTGYLHWLLDLPLWLSFSIVVIWAIPFVTIHLGLLLSSLFTFAFIQIGVHLYTIIFAIKTDLWKGIATIFLPGIAQIYWFTIESINKGFQNSLFCTIMLIYIFILITIYLSPLILNDS